MKANTIQTNFTSGEVSPLLYGRIDVNKYANGAKSLYNMVVRPQGGACRRPGSQFVGQQKASNYIRLISFVVSSTVSYILEFGNTYIRFYTNGGLVTNGGAVEVTTPYLYSELDQITFSQSADVLFIAHPNHPPQMLTRYSNTSWTFTQYITSDGPYLPVNTTNNRAQISLTSDVTTIYSNFSGTNPTNVIITSSGSTFIAGDVGKYIINSATSTTQPLVKITTYTSGTVVIGQFISSSLIITYTVLGANVFYGSGLVQSNKPLFTTSSVGSYIYVNSVWYLITAFTDSRNVSGTAITIKTPGVNTFTVTGSGAFVAGSVGQYVEYTIAGVYYLAKILTVVSSTQATVQVLPQIFTNDGSFDISINGGSVGTPGTAYNTTSSFSAVFSVNDLGKFVRDTKYQRWIQITAFTNSQTVVGTYLNVFSYSYPVTTMTLQDDRVITCSLLFQTPVFDVTDVGTQVRLQFGSQWRSFQVNAVVSPILATGTFSDFIPFDLLNAVNNYNNGFADNYALGAWSTLNGFPAVVALHQQRIWWGNTTNQPATLWASQPADYLNMAPTEEDGSVIATNAINLTIASTSVDPITWIHSGQVLLVGTYSGEHEIVAPGSGGISPLNISQSLQSAYGSLAPTTAFKFGVATLFLQRGGNKLREMVYQFQFDAFNSKDITVISEHIMRKRSGAKAMGYQVDPISVFWIVCNNGDLVSCTYDKDQDIVAFTGHTLTGGVVESIAVIPNTTRDDVYLSVQRTIGGTPVRYIEKILPYFDTGTGDTLTTMSYLDCCQSYSGALATNISGLSYLNGQTVYAIADGKFVGPFTVSAGAITLSVAASVVNVGLLFSSYVGTLSPEGGSQTETSQGKRKTVKEITARVVDSLPFKHGPSLTQLTLIDAHNFGGDLLPSASQNQLFTGDVRFSPDMAWDQQATYYIVQDSPFPLTIDALMPTIVSNE